MVSQLEHAGVVATGLALKRGSLKEIFMQRSSSEVGRKKEETLQRNAREVVVQGRQEQLVVQRHRQDNEVICDNRNLVRDAYTVKGSPAEVTKKPPLLKRRPVLWEKQAQEVKEIKGVVELNGAKELEETKESKGDNEFKGNKDLGGENEIKGYFNF